MALQAPGALEAVAATRAAVCLMHMQGTPRTMQKDPHYDDVVAEVDVFLRQRAEACLRCWHRRRTASRWIRASVSARPLEHNLQLLAGLAAHHRRGHIRC